MGTMTKVEFINGSDNGESVLATESIHIDGGELPKVYRVSGFPRVCLKTKNMIT